MLKEYIVEMYDFNCWGNDLLLGKAAALTPEQFEQDTRFPIHSIKETMVHTLSAEYAYRMRCSGQGFTGLKNEDFADLAAVRNRWEQEKADMHSYLASASDEELSATVTYKVSTGEEFTRLRRTLLTQLLFHSMQHRAEVAQMLTEAGHSPGNIDYTVYRAENKLQ
jgi:uncharacterized damage-inducible protein DinB